MGAPIRTKRRPDLLDKDFAADEGADAGADTGADGTGAADLCDINSQASNLGSSGAVTTALDESVLSIVIVLIYPPKNRSYNAGIDNHYINFYSQLPIDYMSIQRNML